MGGGSCCAHGQIKGPWIKKKILFQVLSLKPGIEKALIIQKKLPFLLAQKGVRCSLGYPCCCWYLCLWWVCHASSSLHRRSRLCPETLLTEKVDMVPTVSSPGGRGCVRENEEAGQAAL